jgi:hypothetical protein
LWLLPIGFVLLLIAVAAARGLRHVPAVDASSPAIPARSSRPAPERTRACRCCERDPVLQSAADDVHHRTPGKDWFRFQRPVPEEPLWTAKQDSVTLPRHLGLPGLGHPLAMLACDMNGRPLSYGHGAPLRLRNEVQVGFKQVKDEDHEFFGYRRSI